MWKFLQSLNRAFRQHVHSPRPSAGVYVEEEQDVVAEKTEKICPFSWIRRHSEECLEKPRCSAEVLNSLHVNGPDEEFDEVGHCRNNAGRKDKKEWWRSCHSDFWQYMRQPNHMAEAISWGSAVLWGTDTDRLRRKTRLLYRVLCAAPGGSGTHKNVVDALTSGTLSTKTPSLLAIKDAAGSAHDTAVNVSKTETLDSAMEEFQSMCNKYTAQNEIILGLEAWETGDMTSAVQHLQTSCLLGNSSACLNLAFCYEKGSGVQADKDKAEHYYRMAAKGGNSLALFNLGLIQMNQYREKEDHGAAQCGCKKNEAISLMEKAARLGLAEAQTYLGMYHMDESDDPVKAVQYFKAAAEQNDAEGQYFLAACYEHGWGVEMNECRAAQLYSLAAGAGHVTALYNLAEFNENGLGGLPVDRSSAIELYQKASDLGSEDAKLRLKEIEMEKEAAEKSKNVKTFDELYINQHGDPGTSHSTVMSPSVSSPNLLDCLHHIPHFFNSGTKVTACKDKPGHRRSSAVDKLDFHFDRGEEFSLASVRPIADEGYQLTERELAVPREMHRSHTYPNIAMVACNM
ncbi:hypothetical protein Btru_032002 [Bulinus truncatus]|nr:hypothetical protein Btru_032002 [Bulinus truncatus]